MASYESFFFTRAMMSFRSFHTLSMLFASLAGYVGMLNKDDMRLLPPVSIKKIFPQKKSKSYTICDGVLKHLSAN